MRRPAVIPQSVLSVGGGNVSLNRSPPSNIYIYIYIYIYTYIHTYCLFKNVNAILSAETAYLKDRLLNRSFAF